MNNLSFKTFPAWPDLPESKEKARGWGFFSYFFGFSGIFFTADFHP
jgi:hypothetical protein